MFLIPGANNGDLLFGNGDTLVLGDVNGDRKADLRIALTGEMALTAGDFIL